jgi:hypothetical protein
MLVLITNTKHYPNLFRYCEDKTCRKDGHMFSSSILCRENTTIMHKIGPTTTSDRISIIFSITCVLRRNISVRRGEFYTTMLATLTTSWGNK